MRLAVLLWLMSCSASSALGQGDYTFIVDGRRIEPELLSLAGTPKRPAPGDLIAIGDLWLKLPEPGVLQLAERMSGLIQRKVGADWRDVVRDAELLVEADAATRAGLLGVCLDAWSPEVAAAVATLDPSVPLVVTDAVALGLNGALPELPAGLQHLALHWCSGGSFRDLSSVRGLRKLRTLVLIGEAGERSIDLESFPASPDFRCFDARWVKLRGLEGFAARWPGTKSVTILDRDLHDAGFLSGARELRRVSLQGTRVSSLAPLASLPHLSVLEICSAPIAELPERGFAALRSIDLEETKVGAEALAAFVTARPGCRVALDVDADRLSVLLRNADRLVVRTGKRVLFASKDEDVVRRIAGRLRVKNRTSWSTCGCGCEARLAFSAEGVPLAELGIVHGRSLRWLGGPWKGDAHVEKEHELAFLAWLADIGADGVHSGFHGEVDLRAERSWRHARRAALLAESGTAKAMNNVELLDQISERIAAGEPGEAFALSLLGCHEGAWNQPDALDQRLLEWLSVRLDEASWKRWAKIAQTESRAAVGFAALFLEDDVRSKLAPEARARSLGLASSAALVHPRGPNRARMLRILRDEPGGDALRLLREALAGRFIVREAPAGMIPSESGIATGDDVLDAADASVPALAALCLAVRKDAASLEAIRELTARSTGIDYECSARAAKLLEAR